jgi:hypothetical protein
MKLGCCHLEYTTTEIVAGHCRFVSVFSLSTIWLIFSIMSILSTDTMGAMSDLSMVYSTDPFGNDGNVSGGAHDANLMDAVTIGNVVDVLWSLPAELGNVLLEDPPEGVLNDVFLDDVNEDDGEESVDLLAESPDLPLKKFSSLRSWTYVSIAMGPPPGFYRLDHTAVSWSWSTRSFDP